MKKILAVILCLTFIFIFGVSLYATEAPTDTATAEVTTELINEPLTQGAKILLWIIAGIVIVAALCVMAYVIFKK